MWIYERNNLYLTMHTTLEKLSLKIMVSESVLCRKDLSALLDVIYSKVEVVDLIFVDMIEGIEGE